MDKSRIKIVIFIITLWGVISCQTTDKSGTFTVKMQEMSSQPFITLETNKTISLDSLTNPISLWCIDTLLIIYDAVEEGFLKFYSLNSYQFLFKFGKIGRGPSEYMAPGIYRNGPNEFILVEKLRYSLFNVDSILANQDYVPVRCNVHFGFSSVNHAGFINDSLLIYSCLVSDYQFSVTNIYSENTVNYSNYPNRIKDHRINDFISNTKVYHSQKQLRPGHKDKMIIAYKYFPIIDFVTVDSLQTKRIEFPENPNVHKIKILDKLNAVIEDPIVFYPEIYPTARYAYLLYYGTRQQQVFDRVQYPEVHQLDWEGNFVQRYRLDQYVSQFCIDENRQTIYAIGVNPANEEPLIYSFEM